MMQISFYLTLLL